MAWTIVAPASRGIGFALARHLLKTLPPTVPVIATARTDLPGTKERLLADLQLSEQESSRLDVRECDVLSESAIANLAGYCKERYNDRSKDKSAHLRLGLMVPGMLVPEKAPDKIEYDSALDTLKLNLLAPMMLAKHFSEFLPRKSLKLDPEGGLPHAAVLALMGARVGSIGDNRLGGWYSYRSSKAGLAMFVRSVDIFLRMKNGTNGMCVGLHPGTVKTSLSQEFWESTPKEKLFSPEFSAERLISVIRELEEPGRGKVWDWQGKEVPP
jgi:NAD(P)-dependent dehydrogenase (short-subunit alcohol dehydrogenase family)